jgi:hypothetical protein
MNAGPVFTTIFGQNNDAGSVSFSVVIRTPALVSSPYTQRQIDLFRRVLALREIEKLTYCDIATRLDREGFLSPRGCPLSAELVYSIYKKGKKRFARMTSAPAVEITDFKINPRDIFAQYRV